MKAAVCRAFRQPLLIEEVRLAEPGPGEVRVRIAACAICHSDILFIEGAWGGDLPAVFGIVDLESLPPGPRRAVRMWSAGFADVLARPLARGLLDLARDWPPELSFYLWGPAVPKEFGENYEGCTTTTRPQPPQGVSRV